MNLQSSSNNVSSEWLGNSNADFHFFSLILKATNDRVTKKYSSQAEIPIHHGARTDRKGRIDKKQA